LQNAAIYGLFVCRFIYLKDASTSAGCAEMSKFRKIGYFVHFGETGDEPDTFIFYFQHNKSPSPKYFSFIFY